MQSNGVQSKRQEEQQVREELDQALHKSLEVLVTARTVFPFDLFPDSITVDRTKVTVTHQSFFMVGNVTNIRIEDILGVTAEIGPFFGSLQITTRFFEQSGNEYTLRYLWRQDALHLKSVIHGLVIATKKNIDVSALNAAELVVQLSGLGRSPDEIL